MPEFPHITRKSNPEGGRTCLRDTEITVSTVVSLAAAGRSHEEITRIFPALTTDDIREALVYAAWIIDQKEVEVPTRLRPGSMFVKTPQREWELEGADINKETHDVSEVPEPEHLEPQSALITNSEHDLEEMQEEVEESLELFHPSCPDKPTVIVTREGLFDRRWFTSTIEWADIREIKYISGQQTIYVTLRNPNVYLASMPFLERLLVKMKLAMHLRPFLLDTASLGIRTKDLYYMVNRLWMLHRGKLRFRKKRRIRLKEKTGRTEQDRLWNNLQAT